MYFYHILWIFVIALSGISLAILGMVDQNLFTLFLINPRILNRLFLERESEYGVFALSYPVLATLDSRRI